MTYGEGGSREVSVGKGTGRVPGANVLSLRWLSMEQKHAEDHEAHPHWEQRT